MNYHLSTNLQRGKAKFAIDWTTLYEGGERATNDLHLLKNVAEIVANSWRLKTGGYMWLRSFMNSFFSWIYITSVSDNF